MKKKNMFRLFSACRGDVAMSGVACAETYGTYASDQWNALNSVHTEGCCCNHCTEVNEDMTAYDINL